MFPQAPLATGRVPVVLKVEATGCCAGVVRVLPRVLPCLGYELAPKIVDDEEFERLLKFLAAVPLFRKQLPAADLPIIGKELKRTVWKPGVHVIEQGEEGKAFFIIQKGEASVVVKDQNGVASVRATLHNGDYFGGHTLVEHRPNVASVICRGPEQLVTLSMSRQNFELLGLNSKLTFPRRPAIYDGTRTDRLPLKAKPMPGEQQRGPQESPLTAEDEAMICTAVRSNVNLKHTIGDVSNGKVQQIAQVAHRMEVQAGNILVQTGDLPTAFFVVAQGSFDIITGGQSDHRSVEATVASRSVAHRCFGQKEQFLQELASNGFDDMTSDSDKRMPAMMIRSVTSKSERDKFRNTAAKDPSRTTQTTWTTTGTSLRGLRRWHTLLEEPSQNAERKTFAEGDTVAVVVVGREALAQEVGTVVEVISPGPDGEVVVEFSDPSRRARHRTMHLRPAKDRLTVATLRRGMTYGELALLYSARSVSTCIANEDSVVYAISRWHFKHCFACESPQLQDHCSLLDEVMLLSPLLRIERREMARNVTGVLQFCPGGRILTQGAKQDQLFYVIQKGSCCLSIKTTDETGEQVTQQVSTLRRAGYFGERMIFRNESVPEYSVDAGPEGATCLVIDGQILSSFFPGGAGAGLESNFGMPSCLCDASEYIRMLHPRRTSRTLDIPFSKLETVGLLGEGGFGAVFRVRYDEREFALKRISKGYAKEVQAIKQVCSERDVLSMIDSNFIVHLHATYKDEQYVYFLLELADGGDLYYASCSSKIGQCEVDPSSAIFYVASLSFALEHLHERSIAYRDLKLENVLLDSHGYVKLCDMGLAKFIKKKSHTLCGTPEYMAPEMIDAPHAHDQSVDWWALGVMTFELLTGQIPWDIPDIEFEDDPVGLLLHVRGQHYHSLPVFLIPRAQKAAKSFVQRLLTVNSRRPKSGAELRQDPWFRSKRFDFGALLSRTMQAPLPLQGRSPRAVPATLRQVASMREQRPTLFQPYENDGSKWDEDF